MAQTQTKTKTSRKPKTRAASKPKSQKRSSSTRSSAPKSRPRPASNSAASKASSPADRAKAVGETIENSAKEASGNVARAVSKAKVPLLAGGAALAGAAGGAAIGARQARRHRGIAGVNSNDLGRAARRMGDLGAQMGEVAIELRRARQATNGKRHRSPIEVVLEGLTSRH